MRPYHKAIRQKNYQLAIEILKKRIATNCVPEGDWSLLGHIYENIEQPELAENAYRKASEIYPSRDLADFLVRHERHDEAAPLIEKILNDDMERMLQKDKYAWMIPWGLKFGDLLSKWVLRKKNVPDKYITRTNLESIKRYDAWQKMAADYLIWYKQQRSG